MPRRSKLLQIAVDQIKAQPARRPRKKREPRIIPFGLKAGQIILISAPRERIKKFGIVTEGCKYDGGVIVRLSDDGPVAKYFCVRPELGDTIERLNSNDGATNPQ